jgi:uncharacterized lipoprotein YajG
MALYFLFLVELTKIKREKIKRTLFSAIALLLLASCGKEKSSSSKGPLDGLYVLGRCSALEAAYSSEPTPYSSLRRVFRIDGTSVYYAEQRYSEGEDCTGDYTLWSNCVEGFA